MVYKMTLKHDKLNPKYATNAKIEIDVVKKNFGYNFQEYNIEYILII